MCGPNLEDRDSHACRPLPTAAQRRYWHVGSQYWVTPRVFEPLIVIKEEGQEAHRTAGECMPSMEEEVLPQILNEIWDPACGQWEAQLGVIWKEGWEPKLPRLTGVRHLASKQLRRIHDIFKIWKKLP